MTDGPVRYGPVGLPKRTLGWQALQWSLEYLQQPDGPDAGGPWRFTDEQARFLLWFYAVDDQGQFLHRKATFRRMKGHGKDPMAAAIGLIEMVGPCRFGGWRADGEPIVVPHHAAWVQVFGVSKEQTKNTMTLIPGMAGGPRSRLVTEYSIDLGKEIVYALHGRRRLEAVTTSSTTAEGNRPTFVIKNETHHWKANNEGLALADTIDRNLAKSRDGSARALSITNAHAPGEGSEAEREWEAYLENPNGILYDSLEAPEFDFHDDGDLRRWLGVCRGDSNWLNVERLMAEIRDPKTGTNTAKRFYLNQLAASEDRAFSLDAWDMNARDGYDIPEGEMVTLGFDGSRRRDATGLVATEVLTGVQQVIGVWERPEFARDWEVPSQEVYAAVREAMRRWRVLRMYCDPYFWESDVAAWAGEFGDKKVIEFHTNQLKRMSYALQAYGEAIRTGDLHHDGHEAYRRHVANAYRNLTHFRDEQGEWMWTIQKERPDSPRKIDLCMAGCLSWEARNDAIAAGEAAKGVESIVMYVPRRAAE